LIVAERECLARYRSIRSNEHKISSPPIKRALSTPLDKRLYAYKGGRFKITTLDKRISIGFQSYPKLDQALSKYPLCDPALFVRGDVVFISLRFNVPSPVCPEKTAIGVDLGIKRAATLSDGTIFKDKQFNRRKRTVRFLKRTLDSKGTKSARRHLKILRRKERNMNKNQSHLLANAILSKPADVFVLEDLTGIKKKNRGKKFNNKLSQVPFFALRLIMEYKALTLGKRTITVNPRDTSKIDNRTGRSSGTRKGCRYYCKNGTVLDADINAAINIAKRGHLPFSCHSALDGQGVVKHPNVCQSGLFPA
jgi:IS605 OrfB family transposase